MKDPTPERSGHPRQLVEQGPTGLTPTLVPDVPPLPMIITILMEILRGPRGLPLTMPSIGRLGQEENLSIALETVATTVQVLTAAPTTVQALTTQAAAPRVLPTPVRVLLLAGATLHLLRVLPG